MGADLGDLAVVHDDDAVGPGGGGQAVGDDQGGAAAGDPLGGLVDQGFRGQVEGGGRLVEEQDVRVDQFGAGQGDQLALVEPERLRPRSATVCR